MFKEPQINTDEQKLNEITFKVNGCAMDVLNAIGHGFHEKIYENALAVAFKKRGLIFSQQRSFDVMFEDINVGTFVPDFIVENHVIVELKVIDKIGKHEVGQILNYLRVTKAKYGLILNFKNPKLDWYRVAL